MATIAARKIAEGGLTESLSSCASGGDAFTNTGVEFVHIKNKHDATTYTITVTAQTTTYVHPNFGSLTKSNITKTVANGNTVFLGPFRPSVFNDANGKAQITYILGTSGTTAISGSDLLTIEVLYLEQK